MDGARSPSQAEQREQCNNGDYGNNPGLMTDHPRRESVYRERDASCSAHGSRRRPGSVRSCGDMGLVFHPSVVLLRDRLLMPAFIIKKVIGEARKVPIVAAIYMHTSPLNTI